MIYQVISFNFFEILNVFFIINNNVMLLMKGFMNKFFLNNRINVDNIFFK